jgi:hypothetical protein
MILAASRARLGVASATIDLSALWQTCHSPLRNSHLIPQSAYRYIRMTGNRGNLSGKERECSDYSKGNRRGKFKSEFHETRLLFSIELVNGLPAEHMPNGMQGTDQNGKSGEETKRTPNQRQTADPRKRGNAASVGNPAGITNELSLFCISQHHSFLSRRLS